MGTAVTLPLASTEEQARARILDAAFECARQYGLGRTTMGDVAKHARLARQSVYRYFPNKHELFFALVLREEEKLIATVRRAIAPHANLREAIEAAFLASLRALRAHPLLDRVMATEPQELLPYLTIEANPVLELSMRIMEEVLRERAPDVPPRLAHRASETCARVFTSYAITPPADDPAEVAATLAELFTNGLEGSIRPRTKEER